MSGAGAAEFTKLYPSGPSLYGARAALQVELEVARARAQSQVYAVLTAEQKAKLAGLRQQFEQRRQERGQRRGGRPDGEL